MAESTRLKDAKRITANLEEERQVEDEQCKQISEWLVPHRGFWPADGDSKATVLERGKKIINPAATLSLERSAGGLTIGMTPEGMPWFGLGPPDDATLEARGVRQWTGHVERLIYTMLRRGGLYQAIHYCNLELFSFGNMLLFHDANPRYFSRFEAITMGSYAISLNEDGELDTVSRRMKWRLSSIVRKYGEDRLSKEAKRKYKDNPHQRIDLVHVVNPRESRDRNKIDNLSMRYRSIIYEDATGGEAEDVLEESGYHEMPYYFAPHTLIGDSDYGMGVGHLAIGHVKQLSETERQKIIALQKIINPPMKKPSNMKGRLDVRPGGENAVSSAEKDGLAPLYSVPVQGYQYVLEEIRNLELRVAAVAKADLFYDMPAEMRPKDMTLGEYMERKRERMQQIAPVVSQYEPRVLDKLIERCFGMLDRMGLIPPPPPALADAGQLEISYISTVAKSLRQVGAESTRALMLDVGNLAQMQVNAGMKPTAIMKVDIPQAVDEIANGYGAPARVIKDDDTFLEELAAMEQAEQQQMQDEKEMKAVEAVSKLGNVKADQNSIAGKIMEQQ